VTRGTVDGMPRSCARPGCSAPATATLTFDGLRRIVWISPLAEAAAYSAGDLCRRHAERFTAPRNWELRDLRPTATAAPGGAGATAPSRFSAPSPTPVVAPTLPFDAPEPRPATAERPAAAAASTPRPLLGARTTDAGPLPTSPLLSRAFRNAG